MNGLCDTKSMPTDLNLSKACWRNALQAMQLDSHGNSLTTPLRCHSDCNGPVCAQRKNRKWIDPRGSWRPGCQVYFGNCVFGLFERPFRGCAPQEETQQNVGPKAPMLKRHGINPCSKPKFEFGHAGQGQCEAGSKACDAWAPCMQHTIA